MIANGQDGYGAPRQLMDRPWDEQHMHNLPAGRPQPPRQPPPGAMQNGTNILAAVGQEVMPCSASVKEPVV